MRTLRSICDTTSTLYVTKRNSVFPDAPAWLSDEAVRHGICLQLEVDRCMEEEARLMQERAVIQEWMLAEWESIQVALNDAGT